MKMASIQRNYEAIRQKTGIDFDRYKEDSWGETIANLVFFPQYALANILKGPGLMWLIVLGVFVVCLLTGHKAFGTLFLMFGLAFGLVNGFYLGCIWFIRSFSRDINGLLRLTVQKSGSVIQSFNDPQKKAAYSASLIDVVKGVIFSMILPEVNKVISKKVPVIGGLVAWISGQAIGKMADSLQGRIAQTQKESNVPEQGAPEQQLAVLQKVENTTEKIAATTGSVAAFPFKVLLGIFGSVWAIVIAILYMLTF